MTMPTPEQIQRTAQRLVDRARDLISDPNNMDVRRDYMKSAFNTDFTAAAILHLAAENARMATLLNTPEVDDFTKGVALEAAHQRERWGANHDAGKAPEDWFWLLGYLGGKALRSAAAGDVEKARHHAISSAAALANWHAALTGESTFMRPGIDPVERGIGEPS